MTLTALETSLALFLVSLLGAMPPLARRWSERGLHLLVAASAGVFLGLVALHLLPELAEPAPRGSSPLAPWLAALAGFFALLLVERLVLARADAPDTDSAHAQLWVSTVLGLSVHALAAGLGFAALLGRGRVEWLALVPLAWHKLTESFSLAAVLRLGALRRRRAGAVLLAFSLVTPLGFLVGAGLEADGAGIARMLTGFAAGTFLFVALVDLLPEAFHGSGRRWPRLLALAIGVVVSSPDPDHARRALARGAEVLAASWTMAVEMAPWLWIGFLGAGLLAQLFSPRWLARHLEGEGARPILFASLIGAPLPLCSCSVLPFATQLRRAGAGRGPTSAFLVATPETGVDSLAVTWGLLGPLFAILRALTAVASAIGTGLFVAAVGRRAPAEDGGAPEGTTGARGGCEPASRDDRCPSNPALGEPAADGSPEPVPAACCGPDPCPSGIDEGPAGARPTLRALPRRVWRYVWQELADDLAGPLLLGIVLSGVLGALLPAGALDIPAARGPLGALVVLAIGIPLYVCASASTPVAAALIAKGLSPGAALVFMLVGPATNLASLAVLTRTLGRRGLLAYLVGLATLALVFGCALDLFWPSLPLRLPDVTGGEEDPGWLANAMAAALLALLTGAWLRRLRRRLSPEAAASCG